EVQTLGASAHFEVAGGAVEAAGAAADAGDGTGRPVREGGQARAGDVVDVGGSAHVPCGAVTGRGVKHGGSVGLIGGGGVAPVHAHGLVVAVAVHGIDANPDRGDLRDVVPRLDMVRQARGVVGLGE